MNSGALFLRTASAPLQYQLRAARSIAVEFCFCRSPPCPSPRLRLIYRTFMPGNEALGSERPGVRAPRPSWSHPMPNRTESRPPNIVFITCHDLGRHLGCYGIPSVRTPVLDGLAAEGI